MFQTKKIAAIVTFVLGSSLAHATPTAGSTNAGQTPPIQLAMMDNMNMGTMQSKDPAKMNSSMPMKAPMPTSMPSMPMQDSMASSMGMDMMGRMRGAMPKGMGNMAPAGQLPGFPGASHLYHVGATDFFLDHAEHINLTTAQQTTLNRIKEKTLLDRSNSERRIEDAEQELWVLTSADSPDAAKIESKVQSIEKQRSSERMAYIRAVGEACKVLTVDQRAVLLGTKSPATQPTAPNAMPMPGNAAPMPDKPMSDM